MTPGRDSSGANFDDPIFVVTLEWEGQKCTWDNMRDFLDELEAFWNEGDRDNTFTVTFDTMSEAAFKALPEFDGW